VTVNSYLTTSSHLVRGKVIKFSKKTCYIDHGSTYFPSVEKNVRTKLLYDQLPFRALVLKGEFVEYTKTKNLTNE
jgi:hypothetical protein